MAGTKQSCRYVWGAAATIARWNKKWNRNDADDAGGGGDDDMMVMVMVMGMGMVLIK